MTFNHVLSGDTVMGNPPVITLQDRPIYLEIATRNVPMIHLAMKARSGDPEAIELVKAIGLEIPGPENSIWFNHAELDSQ